MSHRLISPLTAVLLATAYFIIVDACVCYVGQEPNSIKGEPPRKLLPDQNPCECTEFRPGGVNTKQQAKPHEVTFGNDGHPEGWTEKDCIHETIPSDTMIPCGTWSLTSQSDDLLLLYADGESFHAEFTLQSSTNDLVSITSFIFNSRRALCTVELDGISDQMRMKEDGTTIQTADFQDAFDGSTHYWVTSNQYKLEFGRLGETKPLECQSNKSIDYIYWSHSDMTVTFYGTCPDASVY